MLTSYQMSVLYETVKTLHVLHHPDKIYKFLLEHLSDAVKAESGAVFEVDSSAKKLVLKSCAGPKQKEFQEAAVKVPLPLGKGISGWAALYNQPSLVPDARLSSRFNPVIDETIGYKTRNVLCAPISNQEDVVGVIEFVNRIGGQFSKEDLELVTLASKQAGIAVSNSLLLEELEESRHFTDSMLSNLSGGLIAVNLDETITHFNPSAERILQLSASESIGRKCGDALKGYPAILKEISAALATRERKLRKELYCSAVQTKKSMKIGYSTFLVQDPSASLLGAGLIFQHLE